MTTYKRKITNLIVGLLSAPAAAFFLLAILRYFLSPLIMLIISGIAFILILYLTIFSDNIKFVIDEEDKTMIYYENGKVVKEYDLKNASLSYNMKFGHSAVIDLIINGEKIDCEPLGERQFEKMYHQLEKLVGVEPIKLKVGE
ncbi:MULTISPECIES: hypothetical protein [Fusobacterium]|nr:MULTISPECIES: hypothetical protein [Fusobacterium]EFS29143.2 hypothetical protein FGAG_01464 [Fusobacterium gonidiaformans ATCC 25563]KXA14441.1 hypothetical protein HMPREF3206_01002 [Fusobacterium equinum]